jgi:hypothetical protein
MKRQAIKNTLIQHSSTTQSTVIILNKSSITMAVLQIISRTKKAISMIINISTIIINTLRTKKEVEDFSKRNHNSPKIMHSTNTAVNKWEKRQVLVIMQGRL